MHVSAVFTAYAGILPSVLVASHGTPDPMGPVNNRIPILRAAWLAQELRRALCGVYKLSSYSVGDTGPPAARTGSGTE